MEIKVNIKVLKRDKVKIMYRIYERILASTILKPHISFRFNKRQIRGNNILARLF